MRFPGFIAITGLALICALATANAEKRVALVIGNDRYANLPAHEQLQKAVNDARAVGKALAQLGFEVMSGENVGRQTLVDRIDAFARRLSSGDTAFFFFSGHGVSLGGANYILPADIPNVEADQESRLARTALAENDIVSDLQARGVRVAVVVLDACRTNPFGRSGGKSIGGDKGLAPPPQVKGVFSLYAASSGQAARDRLSDDDRNPNSVFSRVLVPAVTKQGLDLRDLAYEVREEVARVAKIAGYVQEPAYYDGTIGGRVYLAGAPPVREQPVSSAASEAAQAWGIIQNTTSLAVLDDFIRQFGTAPVYGSMARARREELATEQAAKTPAKPVTGQQTATVGPPVKPVVPTHSFSETLADDLAQVLKDGDNLRVATAGAVSNVDDLLYQRSVDVAVTQSDVFEFFRTQRKITNLESRINYIVRLPAAELHVLAPTDINSLQDLRGKKVNFGKEGTDSSLTGAIVFQRLGVLVEATSFDDVLAMQKLRSGEIAALLRLVNKPIDPLAQLPANSGLHLVPVPFTKQFEDFYAASEFTRQDYPTLVPPGTVTDTIAVPQVLAVFNWQKNTDRYRKVLRFVQAFFNKFEQFQQPPRHPKWRDVNLAATVPGWTRSPAAEEMLQQLRQANGVNSQSTAAADFATFLKEKGISGLHLSSDQRDAVFREFMQWQLARSRR